MNTSIQSCQDARRTLNKFLREQELVKDSIRQEKAALAAAEKEVSQVLQAQDYLQKIAELIQRKAQKQIANIVSKCLSAVFEKPYTLKIEFDKKRGRTEARFTYYRDGNRINPRTTSGGVRDVASFALRIAGLMLALPPKRRFLALDEPFLGLAAGNLAKVAKLLEVLNKELDIQFLICTHDAELQVGKVIHL